MYLNKIAAIFLNTTALSRLIYNLTIITFVFLAGFLLDDVNANLIFTTLAIIRMAASSMSFGFGANILKPLIEISKNQRESIILHIILIKCVFVIVASLLLNAFNILENVSFLIIFFTLFGTVWAFVDIYVEALSDKHYKKYFVLKAIFSVLALVIKLLLISINSNLLIYFLTIEGVFSFSFLLVTHFNKQAIQQGLKIIYFKKVYALIKHGFFIWTSSFLQIAGSRLLYLTINSLVPLNFSAFYYIFLRLVEGLMFIPNNVCASFFKKIIIQKDNIVVQHKFRYQMLRTTLVSSLAASIPLFVVLCVYMYVKSIEIENYVFLSVLVLGVTTLSFFRIWVSREIVLNENLIASPISYTASFLFTIISINFLANQGLWIILSLFVYYLVSCIFPFMIYPTRMKSTRLILNQVSNVKIKN